MKHVFFADFSQSGSVTSANGTVPIIAFAMFQMAFAVLTPALIAGAYAERIKFPAMLLFSGVVDCAGVLAHLPLGMGRRVDE